MQIAARLIVSRDKTSACQSSTVKPSFVEQFSLRNLSRAVCISYSVWVTLTEKCRGLCLRHIISEGGGRERIWRTIFKRIIAASLRIQTGLQQRRHFNFLQGVKNNFLQVQLMSKKSFVDQKWCHFSKLNPPAPPPLAKMMSLAYNRNSTAIILHMSHHVI